MNGRQGNCIRLEHLPIKVPPSLAALFPECFPPNHVAELKCDCFYGGLPKCLKAMVAYLKVSLQGKTYSDYLWASREAEKEDSIELSQSPQSPQSQATNNTAKPRVTSFFPVQKLKGTQPAVKTPTMCLAHLEEESAKKEEEVESEDLNGIDGVIEEFKVHLSRSMKDTKMKEKHCYHCSSLEHFIHNCSLVKASGAKLHLNCKEGTTPKKGAQAPQMKATMPKTPQEEVPMV